MLQTRPSRPVSRPPAWIKLLDELGVRYERDAPIGRTMTWFQVGGVARVLAFPDGTDQLARLVSRCRDAGVPVRVLGSGANLLVDDGGADGVVVRLTDPAFGSLHVYDDGLAVGAGYDLFGLCQDAVRAGLGGLESLAGIPATVGGAVRMNAGGTYGDTGRHVARVRVMDEDGTVHDLKRSDLSFGYRQTNITAPFILEAEFALTPGDPSKLRAKLKEVFAYKKKTQPMAEKTAGCSWRNPTPPAPYEDGGKRAPAEIDADAPRTWPAGMLVDRAGLKGHRIRGASVSKRHANFIVCHRGCTARDVIDLMSHVERTVRDRFGVELQREVVVWS